MTAVCPSGHTSGVDDFCDVCGMPIAAAAPQQAPTVPPPPHHVPTQAPEPSGPPEEGLAPEPPGQRAP